MAGEHILIIDDSEEIASLVLALLQPLGYQLTHTEDGKDGLAKALYEKPDLILLDLNLPGMSGISILEALHQRGVSTPVIMMTFHGSESVVARALRLGARDYITKPFQLEELLASVERILEETQAQRAAQSALDTSVDPVTQARPQQAVPTLSSLEVMTRALASAKSLTELVERMTEVGLRVSGADVSALFLVDPAKAGLSSSAIRSAEAYRPDLHIEDEYADAVLRARESRWFPDPDALPSFVMHFEQPLYKLFYVPLKLRNKVNGVFGVAYFHDSPYSEADVHAMLVILANIAALLVENIHVRDRMQETVALRALRDLLLLLSKHLTTPLQVLWKAVPALKNLIQDARVPSLVEQEIKKLAIILSVFKDLASPGNKLYIGDVDVSDIEAEIKRRLASVGS